MIAFLVTFGFTTALMLNCISFSGFLSHVTVGEVNYRLLAATALDSVGELR